MNPLSTLPPPPTGQTGVTLQSLKGLPPPPTGQQGITLAQASAPAPLHPDNVWSNLASGVFGAITNPVGTIMQPLANKVASQVVPAAQQLGADLNNRVNNSAAIQTSTDSTPSKILQQAGEGAGAVNDVLGAGIKAVVPPEVLSSIGAHLAPLVEQAAGTQAGKAVISWWQGLPPETQRQLSATGQIASLLSNAIGAGAAKKGAEVAVGAAVPIAEKTANAAIDTTKGAVDAAKTAVVGTPEKQLANVTKDWTAATPTNKAGFKNARAVLDNSPSTPDFLAKQGLTPSAHVVDGNFVTADSASTLHETANQLSHQTLRPSLQMADYATPKTPVNEVIADAIKNVTNDKGAITEGDKAKIIANINSEADALKAKFPDGMSLTDMHDNKITYAKNGGYSPIKPAADNNLATANRSIASSLQKTVEAKAPESVPVKAFNNYLSQYHKGADYLDALNTKKAPVSLGQQVARAGAKLAGAVVGAHMGGLPAEFAGYQVGKALEHAVENLRGSARTEFMNNLEKTNNPAFQKVQQFLRDKNAGSPGTLKLGPNKTTILPAPSEAVQQKGRALQLQSETPLKRSQPQATAPATINKINTIGDKPTPKTTNVKQPLNRGFIKVGPTKIPPQILKTMNDFTDYVAGTYKPTAAVAHQLEQDAADIHDEFISGKAPLTLNGLSAKFSKVLEKNNFGKAQPRDEGGKFTK